MGKLYYGDNLDVLRSGKIKERSVDVCYIDPPFNSQRTYNQIYNNAGTEDRAQAQAYIDIWTWDDRAIAGLSEITANEFGRYQPQLVDLIKGLRAVLRDGSLLAYLISIAQRVTEIHRALKDSGTFFLHCDPTASHYLKLVLDAIFCGKNPGDFRNEIIWSYESGGRPKLDFGRKHDVIFRYTKSAKWVFNADAVLLDRRLARKNHMKKSVDDDGRTYYSIKSAGKVYRYYEDEGVVPSDVWSDISHLQQKDPERMGYPTQKPEKLLERILISSCPPGGTVLDAYCGCGTSVVVAQNLGYEWVGIDIAYQSLSLTLRRLDCRFLDSPAEVLLDGVPGDVGSATALARRNDDRLRSEFDKWAILTYTENRAEIREKKGGGIDGVTFFQAAESDGAKILLRVTSGAAQPDDIAKLGHDMAREGAPLAALITLKGATSQALKEAKAAGQYRHESMGRSYDRIGIVTVEEIVEQRKRLEIPMNLEVLRSAKAVLTSQQLELLD
jgi:site-specific DNA-methyltransferase (adenine-specific)